MENNKKLVLYPPGGILMWIIIYVELFTFGMAIAALTYYGAQERMQFHRDSQQLNTLIATINTILLLTGGYLVAKGVHLFRMLEFQKAGNHFLWAIFSGIGFMLLKLVEYYGKLQLGFDMEYSTFFMFYWLMTGFHWIHVFVGVVILFFLRRTIIKHQADASLEDIEAGAAFWHMCDLIWLLLFPIFYLLF